MCLLKYFNTLFAGVREKSFVYSITSAGVMQAVTRACGRGEIGNCGCDTNVYKRDTKNQFQWGGTTRNLVQDLQESLWIPKSWKIIQIAK